MAGNLAQEEGSYPILATALAYVRAKATIRTEPVGHVYRRQAVDRTPNSLVARRNCTNCG